MNPSTTPTIPKPAAPRRLAAWTLSAAFVALGAAGCASTPAPTEQRALANAAVTNAIGVGAPEFAPAELALARDKLGRADSAMATKDNDTALLLLQQAQVDAQVAAAKAEAGKARKAAEAVQQANQALREEMARKATQPKP